MKHVIILIVLITVSTAMAGEDGGIVDELLGSYDGITSLTCDVRRDTSNNQAKLRMLSHVFFEKPDRLHVDNVSPLKRTIVCDGKDFYSYIEGQPKGFSRPVSELDEEMLIQLRKVPGTAMDHLMRLRGGSETSLDGSDSFPVRVACTRDKLHAILCLDPEGRLARIEYFKSPDDNTPMTTYEFSNFEEVLPGTWIPRLHHATLEQQGEESREKVRISNLVVNKPTARELFNPAPYFKGVKFVDEFSKIQE